MALRKANVQTDQVFNDLELRIRTVYFKANLVMTLIRNKKTKRFYTEVYKKLLLTKLSFPNRFNSKIKIYFQCAAICWLLTELPV